MKSPHSAARMLAMLAQTQGGYFTAKQAASVGYGYRHLDYHETVGNFERIAHGLYRLPTVPVAEHDDLIRLTLWSRNQKDEPQAVVSHESALSLHELTDLLPNYVHLTVPRTFRKRVPNGCKLHKSTLAANEIEEREGFSVTTPLRTLLDAATSGVSQEQLNLAVRQVIERGLIRRKALEGKCLSLMTFRLFRLAVSYEAPLLPASCTACTSPSQIESEYTSVEKSG